MAEVHVGPVGTYVPTNVDRFAERERGCWDYWNRLRPLERLELKKTVESELQRLLANVENWLPAAGLPTKGALEICIRIYPDDRGDLAILNAAEKRMAEEAVEGLQGLLESLES